MRGKGHSRNAGSRACLVGGTAGSMAAKSPATKVDFARCHSLPQARDRANHRRHPHRRADDERQVGACARARREARRHHHQCQFHAGLSRPAHHHGAADARPTRRACRIGSTAMSTPRRTIRSAAGASMRRRAIAETRQAGRLPILVGGTGLYFKALTQGLAAVPPIPAEHPRVGPRSARGRRCRAAVCGARTQRDPATAERLMPGDRSRITRALEVVLATGRSLVRLASRRHAAVDRCRACGEALSRRRARRALSPHRRALRRDAGSRARSMR